MVLEGWQMMWDNENAHSFSSQSSQLCLIAVEPAVLVVVNVGSGRREVVAALRRLMFRLCSSVVA